MLKKGIKLGQEEGVGPGRIQGLAGGGGGRLSTEYSAYRVPGVGVPDNSCGAPRALPADAVGQPARRGLLRAAGCSWGAPGANTPRLRASLVTPGPQPVQSRVQPLASWP